MLRMVCVQLGRDRLDRKPLKADHQRLGEAVHAVAVLTDVLALDVVQNVANVIGRVVVMVQKGDELRNRALKVNVVLPERVIGVDEQILAGRDFLMGRCGHVGILREGVLNFLRG